MSGEQVSKSVIGSRIRRIRTQMGLSVRDLAALAGVSKMSVVNLEHGKNFRDATLKKLAEAMGLHIENLVRDEPTGEVPFAVHRNADARWFDLSDFARGHYFEGELDAKGIQKIQKEGCQVPLNILKSRLDAGRIKPTVMILSKESETRSHQGEEYVYVLSGRAKITIGKSELILEEGESVSFWSVEPHSYAPADPSDPPATILSVRVDG